MKELKALVKRNQKLFFKDKGMFFTSLITPLILLVLYATFLGKIYRDSFASAVPEQLHIAKDLINGCAGGQLVASLLAVSCVTVAFCSNMLMVQDKVSGSIMDLTVSPVKKSVLAGSYYLASLSVTLIICYVTTGVSMIYLAVTGWYLSAADILFVILDVFLLVMFGTALSSVINFFLNSQGQISAVGTVVSAGYGFICGAYMPLSQFSEGLQKVLYFLPGTYGTSLLRNHLMRGGFAAMEEAGIPSALVNEVKKSVDCNIEFLSRTVTIPVMYLILAGAVLLLLGIYILLNKYKKARKK